MRRLSHRLSTFVHTPALSFTILVVGSRTYVVVTSCPSAPGMVRALIVFVRAKGLLVADGAVYAGVKPHAEDVDRVVCALQIGLATLDSIALRIPVVKTENVKAMGFAWGEGARANPTDSEDDAEELSGADGSDDLGDEVGAPSPTSGRRRQAQR